MNPIMTSCPLSPANLAPLTAGRPIVVCWIQYGGRNQWAKEVAGHLRVQEISVRFVSYMREIADGYAAVGWLSDSFVRRRVQMRPHHSRRAPRLFLFLQALICPIAMHGTTRSDHRRVIAEEL